MRHVRVTHRATPQSRAILEHVADVLHGCDGSIVYCVCTVACMQSLCLLPRKVCTCARLTAHTKHAPSPYAAPRRTSTIAMVSAFQIQNTLAVLVALFTLATAVAVPTPRSQIEVKSGHSSVSSHAHGQRAHMQETGVTACLAQCQRGTPSDSSRNRLISTGPRQCEWMTQEDVVQLVKARSVQGARDTLMVRPGPGENC